MITIHPESIWFIHLYVMSTLTRLVTRNGHFLFFFFQCNRNILKLFLTKDKLDCLYLWQPITITRDIGSKGVVPSGGVFLRRPDPYLRNEIQNSKKTTEDFERLLRDNSYWVRIRTYRLPVLSQNLAASGGGQIKKKWKLQLIYLLFVFVFSTRTLPNKKHDNKFMKPQRDNFIPP